MKLAIISIAVLLIAAGAAYFVFNHGSQIANDLGGEIPEKMFALLSDTIKKGDIASAEKYFISQDVKGRKVWSNILAVNKEKGLLEKLADSLVASKFLKSISEAEQQFIIYSKSQSQGILINLVRSEKISLWQIKSLGLVNLKTK